MTDPDVRIAALRDALYQAGNRLHNCWNAGQTFGYIREQAELGLTEVRSALALDAGPPEGEPAP